MTYVGVFCFIVAFIIVVTKLVLEFMEEKDRRNGMIINRDEYRMGGLIKILWKERVAAIKNFFKRNKNK